MRLEWCCDWEIFIPENEDNIFFGRLLFEDIRLALLDRSVMQVCDTLMLLHCIIHQEEVCCKCNFNSAPYLAQSLEPPLVPTFSGRSQIRI
jgi:hypothetical protein